MLWPCWARDIQKKTVTAPSMQGKYRLSGYHHAGSNDLGALTLASDVWLMTAAARWRLCSSDGEVLIVATARQITVLVLSEQGATGELPTTQSVTTASHVKHGNETTATAFCIPHSNTAAIITNGYNGCGINQLVHLVHRWKSASRLIASEGSANSKIRAPTTP